MSDRLRSTSWVHMSEDKMCRKDWCWSVRVDYVLEKLSDVSGLGLVDLALWRRDVTEWYHSQLSWFNWCVYRSCIGMVCMAGVDPEWSHNMSYKSY